jgi:hypothetical protein
LWDIEVGMAALTAEKKARAEGEQKRQQLRKPLSGGAGGDALTNARLQFALAELEQAGALAGARSEKLSTRVDPGLLDAARRRTGLRSDSDLINAALAVVAAGDDFGAWLVRQAGRLPEDFELAL